MLQSFQTLRTLEAQQSCIVLTDLESAELMSAALSLFAPLYIFFPLRFLSLKSVNYVGCMSHLMPMLLAGYIFIHYYLTQQGSFTQTATNFMDNYMPLGLFLVKTWCGSYTISTPLLTLCV